MKSLLFVQVSCGLWPVSAPGSSHAHTQSAPANCDRYAATVVTTAALWCTRKLIYFHDYIWRFFLRSEVWTYAHFLTIHYFFYFCLFFPLFTSDFFVFFNLCHRRGVFSTFRPQFPPTTVHKSESSHVKDGAICGNVSNPWNPWCEMYVITTIAEMQLLPPLPLTCVCQRMTHTLLNFISTLNSYRDIKVSWANEVKRNSFSNRIFY